MPASEPTGGMAPVLLVVPAGPAEPSSTADGLILLALPGGGSSDWMCEGVDMRACCCCMLRGAGGAGENITPAMLRPALSRGVSGTCWCAAAGGGTAPTVLKEPDTPGGMFLPEAAGVPHATALLASRAEPGSKAAAAEPLWGRTGVKYPPW